MPARAGCRSAGPSDEVENHSRPRKRDDVEHEGKPVAPRHIEDSTRHHRAGRGPERRRNRNHAEDLAEGAESEALADQERDQHGTPTQSHTEEDHEDGQRSERVDPEQAEHREGVEDHGQAHDPPLGEPIGKNAEAQAPRDTDSDREREEPRGDLVSEPLVGQKRGKVPDEGHRAEGPEDMAQREHPEGAGPHRLRKAQPWQPPWLPRFRRSDLRAVLPGPPVRRREAVPDPRAGFARPRASRPRR